MSAPCDCDSDPVKAIAARLLGVAVDATPGQLRVAHRAAAKASHPDLFPPAERRQRSEAFHALTAAYRLLAGCVDAAPDAAAHALEPRRPSPAEVRYRTVLTCPRRGVRLDLAA